MPALSGALRQSLLAAGAALAGTGTIVASNHFLAGLSTSKAKTTFHLHPADNGPTNRLFVVFHGLWEGPDRLVDLTTGLTRRGDVLMAATGGNDLSTPRDTLDHILAAGLGNRRIYIVGFSKGTLVAVLFARACRAAEVTVSGMIVINGPADRQSVRWPRSYLPTLVSVLEPGPVVNLVWRAYWRRRYLRDVAAFGHDSSLTARSRWCMHMHAGAVISGARLLKRGIDLQPAEFDFPALIFQNDPDPMIAECAQGWLDAMPNGTALTIPIEGHGVFDHGLQYFETGFDTLLAAA